MALTKGSIEKLLREVVGDDIPISKETVDWVNECAGELLQIVGQEANMIAESISTKENYRISHEHVVTALENLGMQRYAQEIKEHQGLMELETQKKRERIASRKAAAKTASRDELLAEQTALFKQASLKASREGW
ncbi:putative negative cofactor 2 complex subunit beta (NC2 complex subunit beta) [Phytophthora infestans]|uniref:Putative negative cofactor 2 complex subunit beta (NC2 complex subunit beta) n=1 Tax=Phytophthora infestans TaxID=4787 RepID=A0A833SQG2_PHYIN|nr:putative negative cofactor 2 complex subunit beta (NC2 complex subunit beta) [Phytophthora infestans]KAF4142634.1 putative negative cofactor 2 complex subunit beta (NC2 complex subunit beta) [Phytophthora infestans]